MITANHALDRVKGRLIIKLPEELGERLDAGVATTRGHHRDDGVCWLLA